MDKYKKIIPCIFIEQGNAVKWINDKEVLTEDVVGLAKGYYENGADEYNQKSDKLKIYYHISLKKYRYSYKNNHKNNIIYRKD